MNTFNYGNLNNMLFYPRPTNQTDKTLMDKNMWTSIYYRTLSNILMGLFEYDNMTYTLAKRLNYSTFNSTYFGAFLYENELVFAPIIPIGEINAWGEYSNYNAVLPNGKYKQLNHTEVVIGSNLYMPIICDSALCYAYAKDLAELKISIENAIVLSRKSAVIESDNSNEVNELLTQFNSHTLGNPVIIKKSRTTGDGNRTLAFGSSVDIEEYYSAFRNIITDFLTVTGLSSLVNPNKKERLIVAESESNEDIKNTLIQNRIDNRQYFIDEVNKKFNTDFKIQFNESVDLSNFESMMKTENVTMNGGVKHDD